MDLTKITLPPIVKIVILAGLAILLIGFGTLYVLTGTYTGKIGPGVKIGPFVVGGMDEEQARTSLYKEVDLILSQGLSVNHEGKTANISLEPFAVSADVYQEYVDFYIETAVQSAYERSHHENAFLDMIRLAGTAITRPTINIPLELQTDELLLAIENEFPSLAESPINAGFDITPSGNDWTIKITGSKPGTILEQNNLFASVRSQLSNFVISTIQLNAIYTDPAISEEIAVKYTDPAYDILINAPYTLTYEEDEFELPAETIANALTLTINDGEIEIVLDEPETQIFFDAIAQEIEVEAEDARFNMEDGKVTEFVGSQQGIAIDRTATIEAVAEMWEEEETKAEIVVEITEPRVTTEEVNNLGINEILGVGTSDFSGSPWNRIQNIKHGASKLNGVLIAPDEEVSLLELLRPFTIADGYKSELVIVGDEIKPEVGGGLCQIGTTTFRAVLNAGLEVLERRNHSLVVSYYDDATNGNPGTDATIYDPSPDFRFKNDTDNYILLTTEVNEDNYELEFTFWGTSDGRSGWYDPPIVTSWSNPGETKYVETTDLAPGEESCQGAHWGANAGFTSYIEWSDGTIDETVYSSHYRALPRTCLVGVDPDAIEETCEDEEECEEVEEVETETDPELSTGIEE